MSCVCVDALGFCAAQTVVCVSHELNEVLHWVILNCLISNNESGGACFLWAFMMEEHHREGILGTFTTLLCEMKTVNLLKRLFDWMCPGRAVGGAKLCADALVVERWAAGTWQTQSKSGFNGTWSLWSGSDVVLMWRKQVSRLLCSTDQFRGTRFHLYLKISQMLGENTSQFG